MKRYIILSAMTLLVLVLGSGAASARDITVTFTEAEAQTIINDLDLATKAGGLQVAIGALPIVQKLQTAAAQPPVAAPAAGPSLKQ